MKGLIIGFLILLFGSLFCYIFIDRYVFYEYESGMILLKMNRKSDNLSLISVKLKVNSLQLKEIDSISTYSCNGNKISLDVSNIARFRSDYYTIFQKSNVFKKLDSDDCIGIRLYFSDKSSQYYALAKRVEYVFSKPNLALH